MRHSSAQPRSSTSACPKRQPLSRRDPQLLRDEVDAGDQLRDGMLDLEPRVDLEEVEAPRLVEQELRRAGVPIAGRPRHLDRRRATAPRAEPRRQPAKATPR